MLSSKWEMDAGGLPPVVLLPAIQHTGSRFVRWDILKRYEHAQLYEGLVRCGRTAYYAHLGPERKPDKFIEYLEKYPAIAPLRHPRRVFKSWISRGQKVSDCILEWEFLINKVAPFNPYYLPIDSEDRELYLNRIHEDLNLRNDANWRPRGNEQGTMYLSPEEIVLTREADDYIESISDFTEQFWSTVKVATVETTEVKGVLFKSICSKRVEAYGYIWQPEGSVGNTVNEVVEPNLIEKFRLYNTLQAIEFIEQPKEIEDVQTDVEFETLKSQAIAQGLKVDGRWSDTRLEREIKSYLSEANGNDN